MTQFTLPATLRTPATSRAVVRARRRSAEPRHYRIGPVSVTLRWDVRYVQDAYHARYRAYEVDTAAAGPFRIDVIARRSWRTGRRHYHILSNGETTFTVRHAEQILPHVEGAINLLIAQHLPDLLQIHASAMSRDGTAVVFPGPPGSGKTTLAAALLARGWSYATDEFALIDPKTRMLVPYPKALSIKPGSLDLLRRAGLPLDDHDDRMKQAKSRIVCLDPLRVRPGAVARPCPVGLIVFPRFEPGRPPALEPISAAQAVYEMARRCFNFLKFRARAIELLADLVRDARCFRLATGDPDRSCDLVQNLLPHPAGEEP